MISLVLKRNNKTKLVLKVSEDATPGTWGSHQLLLHEYRMQDKDDHWAQALFNYKWLKDMELDYGPLWCCYCGKEELRIYHFKEKQYLGNMATVDHYIARSKAPELSRDKKNLRVACWRCNNKKADKTWEVKFPYDNEKPLSLLKPIREPF